MLSTVSLSFSAYRCISSPCLVLAGQVENGSVEGSEDEADDHVSGDETGEDDDAGSGGQGNEPDEMVILN